MLAAIIAFIGAFLRALAVSRAAVHHRQVSERWHAAAAQLADSLGRMGIPESLAATVGPDEIAALKFFFDERAVQADLSQKINLARARLDENRDESTSERRGFPCGVRERSGPGSPGRNLIWTDCVARLLVCLPCSSDKNGTSQEEECRCSSE